MGRSPRQHFFGAIFHVMGRGNGGQTIFSNDEDRLSFLAILHDVLSKTGGSLLAYCLMGNHYHLLSQVGEISISDIMRRVLTRYAKRFNIAAKRFGHVFQARFKAKLCVDDAYLLTVLRYIHNNPLEAGLSDNLSWPWSSHRQLVGRIRSVALDLDAILEKLGSSKSEALWRYQQLMDIPSSGPLPTFDDVPYRSSAPAISLSRPALDALAGEVCALTGIDVRGLPGGTRSMAVSKARKQFCARAARHGYGVSAIAKFLCLSPSSVHEQIQDAVPI